MKQDFQDLGNYGRVDLESGGFIFDSCDICNGPKLGHIVAPGDECKIKPKMKKDTIDWIEEILMSEPEFEIALAKLDKRPGLVTCNLCNKVFENRYALESHMRFDEMKKNFKSQINILQVAGASSKDEYMCNLNSLLEKMVDRQTTPNVTQISKPKPPPLWAGESYERYKEQVIAWTESNKDPEYTKYHDLIEKLKQTKDIPGLKEFVTTTVIDKLQDSNAKTVPNVIKCLDEKYAKTKMELFSDVLDKISKFNIDQTGKEK